MPRESTALDRRAFLAYFSAAGLGGTLFPGVLWAHAQAAQEITKEMIRHAEAIAGLEFTEEEREAMVEGLNRSQRGYLAMREVEIPNSVPPALRFDPDLPGTTIPAPRRATAKTAPARVRRPADLEEVAFWPLAHLAELVRTRQVTSVELTEMYLDRLERHGPTWSA